MGSISPRRDELAADMKATLAARRELGPEMDDELVELLLARVDGYVQTRLSENAVPVRAPVQQAQLVPPRRRARRGTHPIFVWLLVAWLAMPLLAHVHVVHVAPVLLGLVLLALILRAAGSGTRHM